MRKIIPEGKFRYLRMKEKKSNDEVKIAKLKWKATFKSFEWDRFFFFCCLRFKYCVEILFKDTLESVDKSNVWSILLLVEDTQGFDRIM